MLDYRDILDNKGVKGSNYDKLEDFVVSGKSERFFKYRIFPAIIETQNEKLDLSIVVLYGEESTSIALTILDPKISDPKGQAIGYMDFYVCNGVNPEITIPYNDNLNLKSAHGGGNFYHKGLLDLLIDLKEEEVVMHLYTRIRAFGFLYQLSEFNSLNIIPEWRNKGLGSVLISIAFLLSKSLDCDFFIIQDATKREESVGEIKSYYDNRFGTPIIDKIHELLIYTLSEKGVMAINSAEE